MLFFSFECVSAFLKFEIFFLPCSLQSLRHREGLHRCNKKKSYKSLRNKRHQGMVTGSWWARLALCTSPNWSVAWRNSGVEPDCENRTFTIQRSATRSRLNVSTSLCPQAERGTLPCAPLQSLLPSVMAPLTPCLTPGWELPGSGTGFPSPLSSVQYHKAHIWGAQLMSVELTAETHGQLCLLHKSGCACKRPCSLQNNNAKARVRMSLVAASLTSNSDREVC